MVCNGYGGNTSGELLFELGPVFLAYDAIREPECARVLGSDSTTGQREEATDAIREAPQEARSCAVREKTNPDFGHRQPTLGCQDSQTASDKETEARSHYGAVTKRDNRFRKTVDSVIDSVLGREHGLAVSWPRFGELLTDRPNIAAGTEAAFAVATDRHDRDFGIYLPATQHVLERLEHLEIQRVNPRGARKNGEAQGASPFETNQIRQSWLRLGEGLIDILDDVIHMLDADR